MEGQTPKTLEDVKKLLILGLIANGVTSADIAKTLDVNKSTISRIVPARSIKKG